MPDGNQLLPVFDSKKQAKVNQINETGQVSKLHGYIIF
jgi:hypothetical protein